MIVPLRCSSSGSDSASTCGSADAKNELKELQCNKTHKIVAAEKSQEKECRLFIIMMLMMKTLRVCYECAQPMHATSTA